MIHRGRIVEVLGRNASLRIRNDTETLPKSRPSFRQWDVQNKGPISTQMGMTENVMFGSYFGSRRVL